MAAVIAGVGPGKLADRDIVVAVPLDNADAAIADAGIDWDCILTKERFPVTFSVKAEPAGAGWLLEPKEEADTG